MEELTEEGVVKESKNGIATIVISNSDQCDECSAKLYCKPGNSSERSLIVKDPFGTTAGDRVMVSINGSRILGISFLIYGIPLVFLLAGLIIGMNIFQSNKEIFSTLFGVGLVLIYILIIRFMLKKRENHITAYPQIVLVNAPKH
ncbi:MAG TPA: hypothetical protein DHV28_13190 [Ignavibacteriales bacterium]|nr:hypothetical protein [Ignavibacteriales bacterium]